MSAVALLGSAMLESCGSDTIVVVTVTGLTPDITALKTTSIAGGLTAMEMFPGNQSQFGLRLPSGTRGDFSIDIEAQANDTCLVGKGRGSTIVSGEPRVDVTVALIGGKLCPITVTKVGAGTVVSTPAGIQCGATCTGQFAVGSQVSLTATPDDMTQVANFSGACSGGAPCKVTVNGMAQVAVTFGPSATSLPSASRLVSPLSTSSVTSRMPTLRWAAAAGAASYSVELCSDPLCGTVLTTLPATGTSATPPAQLPANKPIFWRVQSVNSLGKTPSPIWLLFTGATSASHSTSWNAIFDANRDGMPDLVVGSASNKAFYFRGGATTLPTAVTTELTGGSGFGRAVANAGDLNGDGYGDIVIGAFSMGSAYVYYGGPNGIGTTPTLITNAASAFGSTVAGLGDINGDGYGDIIIGSDDIASQSFVYLGGPTGIATTPTGSALPGAAVAGAGDVNGDGFADVVVGSRTANTAYVYLGAAAGLQPGTTLTKPAGKNSFGEGVAGVGDVNGDGYTEVGIVTQGTDSVFVYYGSAAGTLNTGATMLAGIAGGGAGVKTSAATAGDVNGDGYGDVAIGAYNGNAMIVYYGAASGVMTTGATQVVGPTAGQYANAVLGVGDINGDGYGDVIMAPSQCSGHKLYLYGGGAAGLTGAAALQSWDNPNASICPGPFSR